MEAKNNYLTREQIYANRVLHLNTKYLGNGSPSNVGAYAGQMNHFETITFKSTPTKDWKGSDWMLWHKLLLQAFKNGSFASGIKYTPDKALELTNQVFLNHWNKTASFKVANFGGYSSDFFTYFKSFIISINKRLSSAYLWNTTNTCIHNTYIYKYHHTTYQSLSTITSNVDQPQSKI